MSFIEHIPGTNPVITPSPHPERKGVGVLGLHEGRTLLIALATRCGACYPVAGCDRDPAKREASRLELPKLFYTADYDAMLARDDVEIVAIYTPDAQHADHILRAFDAGKDVICTKPLINNLADAARLLEAGRATGRRLMVGQSTRFFHPFLRQRSAYENGEIGMIELADAHYIHRMDWYYRKSPWAATETDWVFLGLSHPLDLLRWYLGPIAEVQAFGQVSSVGREFHVRGNDMYLVNAQSERGVLGRAMGHYGVHELPRARNCIELMLYGSGGSSLAQYHDMRYLHTTDDNTEVVEDHLYAGRHYYFNSEVHGMHYGEFANYAEHFALSLINGTPNEPDLEQGLETVCIMEAVRQSAANGGTLVPVAPLLREIGLR